MCCGCPVGTVSGNVAEMGANPSILPCFPRVRIANRPMMSLAACNRGALKEIAA